MDSETNTPLEIIRCMYCRTSVVWNSDIDTTPRPILPPVCIRCRLAGAVHWVEFTAGETIEAGDLLMYKGGLCFRAIPSKRIRRKQLSRRRGTPWYRHRDVWARRYVFTMAGLRKKSDCLRYRSRWERNIW